jgi:hypothetical protein
MESTPSHVQLFCDSKFYIGPNKMRKKKLNMSRRVNMIKFARILGVFYMT